ncbi:MAG: hypothetical protein F6J86_00100 [Symploca sp. SIO1B1]|nr:hypothetical protein [Symploca sp. SIO1B1]
MPDRPQPIDVSEITRGIELDPTQYAIFRGGDSFKLRPTEYIMDKVTGLVKPTHGVSLDIEPNNVDKFGGAYQIKSIPPELKIVQRGSRMSHFEVVPREAMQLEDFQAALNKIELYN